MYIGTYIAQGQNSDWGPTRKQRALSYTIQYLVSQGITLWYSVARRLRNLREEVKIELAGNLLPDTNTARPHLAAT